MSDKEFKEIIQECMLYKDPIGLKKFILEDKFSEEDAFWELMTVLGGGINEENYNTCLGFFEACERCMKYLIRVGNPKELILALLEEGDNLNDPVRFQTYLTLIQDTILKLPSKQAFSLELALETLNEVIRNLELPSNLDLDGEERQAHDLDPNVDNINRYLIVFIDFLKKFVDDMFEEPNSRTIRENDKLRICLNKSLLKLLDHPLLYLDLTLKIQNERVIKSNSRVCAERVVSLLSKLNKKLADFIEQCLENNDRLDELHTHQDLDDLPDRVPILSLACLTYLVYRESVIDPMDLCLYSAEGLFTSNLVFILELIKRCESEVQAKGVMLLQHLVQQLDQSTVLSFEELDRGEYFKILEAMFDVMVHSSVKDVRKTCAMILPSFIQLFDLKARYQIFLKIFGTVHHSGAYGYCVQLFKNQVEEVLSKGPIGSELSKGPTGSELSKGPTGSELSKGPTGSELSKGPTGSEGSALFFNVNLKRILLLITNLPEDSATDLVENSDRLIAVMNFIRYLVLRDPPSVNATGFWNYHDILEKDFLKPIQVGLDMSKGHYKCELMGLEKGKVRKTGDDEGAEMSVSVAGFSLPKMDRGQKMEIMKQALNTLDLLTSLFVRVNELIEMKQKENNNEGI